MSTESAKDRPEHDLTAPDRANRDEDGESTGGPNDRDPSKQTFYCDLCGSVMLNLHCKLICERCGYKRDCSDP